MLHISDVITTKFEFVRFGQKREKRGEKKNERRKEILSEGGMGHIYPDTDNTSTALKMIP